MVLTTAVWLPYTPIMMEENDLRNKISYYLLELVSRYIEVDKKTRYYGTDVPIHYSEIHMLEAIKNNEDIHVSGLASFLGVTKGSISEITRKLEKKRLIRKETDSQNRSKLLLRLTPKGEIACENHKKYHQKFNDIVTGILKDQPDDRIVFLMDFLNALGDMTEGFEKEI